MRQIEDAICALEESCKSLSAYSNLCARQKTIRQKCIMRVAKAMSGENDGDELLSDAAGIHNVTAKKIAVSYQLAKCDPGNAQFRNRRAREWAVNVLSFLVGSGSRTSIETLGVSMGDDLYSSVKDFSESGQLIFFSEASSEVGRGAHPDRFKIHDAWIQRSHESPRVSVDGVPLRVVKGSLKNVADDIATELQCSHWAATSYRPVTVTLARKLSDLCLNCESLRRVRVELINLARQDGFSVKEPSILDGQKVIANVSPKVLEYWLSKSSDGGVSDVVADLLDQHSILQWHEDLGKQLRSELHLSQGEMHTIVVDFASDLTLKSHRGDAREFYKPLRLSHFGLMVTSPPVGGTKKAHYIDVLAPSGPHTSRSVVDFVTHGIEKAKEVGILKESDPIHVFCDKASHFSSGESAYGILVDATRGFSSARMTYHVCYHGKTPLDSHFAHFKKKIESSGTDQWGSCFLDTFALVKAAVSSLPRTTVTTPPDNLRRERKRFRIPQISAIHRLQIEKSGAENEEDGTFSLSLEGAPYVPQVTVVEKCQKKEKAATYHGEANWLADMHANCERLRKQRRKLESFKSSH